MGAMAGLTGGGTGGGDPGIGVNGSWGNGAIGKGLGNGKGIGGLFGTAGGAGGSGFNGPEAANIQSPVTSDQIAGSQAGVGTSLGSSQDLLSALQAQGGAGNQTQVYNQGQAAYNKLAGLNGTGTMGQATGQQGALNKGLAGVNGTGAMTQATGQQGALNQQLGHANGVGVQQGGIGALQNVYGQQGNTLGQLQGVANGTGPNPAQAMLNQATGQNVANQSAMMAGQRGAGSNVGLMARQAAQQGAATQQQAAGQGATMQANQQLNALGQMGGQESAMGNTAGNIVGAGAGLTGQQQAGIGQQFGQGAQAAGMQQSGINALYGQGQGAIGAQQAQQGMNAGIAQNQVGNLAGATNSNLQGNLSNQSNMLGAAGNFNTAQVGSQNNINAGNVGLAQTQMQGQQAMLGGTLSGAGAGASMMGGGARGGYVHMADGGMTTPYAAPNGEGPVLAENTEQQPLPGAMAPAPGPAPVTAPPPQGPQSALGQYLAGQTNTSDYMANSGWEGEQAQIQANNKLNAAPTDTAIPNQPQMGYGSQMLYKGAHDSAKMGTMAAMAASRGGLAHEGGPVKTEDPKKKAEKPGNSYANDKVPAMLSEKEIVLPRSVTLSADPGKSAADFVERIMARRRSAS